MALSNQPVDVKNLIYNKLPISDLVSINRINKSEHFVTEEKLRLEREKYMKKLQDAEIKANMIINISIIEGCPNREGLIGVFQEDIFVNHKDNYKFLCELFGENLSKAIEIYNDPKPEYENDMWIEIPFFTGRYQTDYFFRFRMCEIEIKRGNVREALDFVKFLVMNDIRLKRSNCADRSKIF